MTESVLLAVGGGAGDSAAIDWVAKRAETHRITVRIVTVLDAAPSTFGDRVDAAELANARLRAEAPRLAVTAERLVGHPFDVLSHLSDTADLMVLGASEPSPLAGLLHLGLPARLAGEVHCDLVVVPQGWRPVTGAVVVGWEDSDASTTAVERAAEEARHLRVPLVMVHAWMPPMVTGADPVGDAAMLGLVQRDEERSLSRALDAARRTYTQLEITADSEMGAPERGIRRKTGASLLVVGTHHRGALTQILFGTTDDALVAANVQVPVLVVSERPPHLAVR